MNEVTAAAVHRQFTEVLRLTLEERGDLLEEPLLPETLIGADLGISSVELIHLMCLLEERLGIPLDFQALAVRDGDFVEDLSAAEIEDFLAASLGLSAGGVG